MNTFSKNLIFISGISISLFSSCGKDDVIKEPTVQELLSSKEKKEWLIKSTAIEVINASGIVNTYPLTLDCEVDDIWEFENTGDFKKYENKTKCKGEPNELKVESKWILEENNKVLYFSNWRFLNNKEIKDLRLNVENVTDSSFTLIGSKVYANTGKLTLVFKKL